MLTRQTRQKAVLRHTCVAVLVAACAGAACDKVPLMAPTESVISLFANATSVAINGTVEITATVIESAGTPVQNGTVVTFFTSLGTIDPPEARTQNGKATVRLHAGTQSGTATIRAASGGNGTKDPQLAIAIGGAAAGRVELFATPSALPSGGGAVQLTAVVYDGGGNRLANVQVSFGADNGSVSPTSSLTDGNGEARSTLSATGTTKVTVTVAGSGATPVSNSIDIRLRSAPDVTLAITAGSTPTVGQAVTFTATVKAGTTGAAVRTAVVEFGDGASQSVSTNGTSTVSRTYAAAGTYTATLTATDAAGETSTATASVVVRAPAPVAVTLTSSPASPAVNSPVAFTASATAPAGTTIDRYEWNFGNGAGRTTTGGSTSYVYTSGGRFTVSVRVVTTDGASGTAQLDIVVTGMSVALSASPLTPTAGSYVTLTATVTPAAVTISRFEWNFGDGSTRTTTGSATSYAYATGGRFTVTVRAVTTDGASATGQTDVVVTAQTPVSVTLTATPSSAGRKATVAFVATATVPAGSAVARYEWNFGNNSDPRTTTAGSTTYAYPDAGRFTASVQVVTTDGSSATAQADVVVGLVSASVTALPTTVAPNSQVTFTVTNIVPSSAAIEKYEWTLDVGVTRTTTANTTTTTYTTAGNREVTVRVVGIDGSSVVAQMTFEVR